jgi:hypothetical protein
LTAPGEVVRLFSFTLLFLTLFSLVAQEDPVPIVENTRNYVIRDVEVNIDGLTRKDILLYNLGIEPGESFPKQEDFFLWLEEKSQVFRNFRTFSKSKIEYTQELDSDTVFIDLVLTAIDSWSIIILPKPKYDSNVGLQISLSGRDYNFLGSMEPLRVNFDYDIDSAFESTFGFEFDTKQPFLIYDEYFQVGINNYTTLHPEGDPENDLNLYLEYQKQLGDFKFFIRGTQEFEFLPRDSAKEIIADNLLTNELSLRTTYSFPFLIPGLGKPTYSPKVFINREYVLGNDYRTYTNGVTAGFDHALSFGRINWEKNLRQGIQAAISNLFEYDIEKEDWDRSLDILFQYNYQWGWAGLSSRLGGKIYFDKQDDDLGGKLRGDP